MIAEIESTWLFVSSKLLLWKARGDVVATDFNIATE
jgi:hypothetical protein